MSIPWEKSETWWWIVRKTGDSKPFFFAFDTVCGVVPGVIGYCVIQLTNSRNPQLEAELRQTARPFSLEDNMGSVITSLKRKRSFTDRGSDSNVNSRNGNMSRQASTSVTVSGSGSCNEDQRKKRKKGNGIKNKYSFIPDNFKTLEEVTAALREAGLESSNLILGIDFTKSNEWNGQFSFNNRSLHFIGDTPNPYEKAISIIGKTIAPFGEDNLIPCFGFGDTTTHDNEVYSFHSDQTPCHGFEEVLSCYRKIVPNLRFSGPTSYAPVIEAAIDIVEKSGGQYHVLVIVADSQVTRSVGTCAGELTPQEQKTIQSIVDASSYPLSIILVGVGDGSWVDMKKFDDKIPAREFDNFQFVNFTDIMSRQSSLEEKEAAFALAALEKIPFQYRATIEFGLLMRTTGRAPKIVPRPPPVPYSCVPPEHVVGVIAQACPICLTSTKDLAFGCGHMTCRDCGSRVTNCPICRQRITDRLRVYI